MITIIFVLLAIICVLLILAYSLLVMAHDADERADRMYRKWKEEINERNGRSDKTQ